MMYIHEHEAWPELTWDAATVAQPLAAVRFKQGALVGRMGALGVQLVTEAHVDMAVGSSVHSAAIEGEVLPDEQVRSSVARRLGLDARGLVRPSRAVDGMVAMQCDATLDCHTPLSAERLCRWQAGLFVGNDQPEAHVAAQAFSGVAADVTAGLTVGAWRTDAHGPMRVVSGALGRERIHYQAPSAKKVDAEMRAFLQWFADSADTLDPILRAALAHIRFLTVHPFDDGNGRVARAIADMALAQGDAAAGRFYSLSSQILADRDSYYQMLEATQRGNCDVTLWVLWFIECLDRSLDAASAAMAAITYKSRVWQRVADAALTARQRAVIERMLQPEWTGFMTNAKYAKIAKCSGDTALRDIRQLVSVGIFDKNIGGGRSTSYSLFRDG